MYIRMCVYIMCMHVCIININKNNQFWNIRNRTKLIDINKGTWFYSYATQWICHNIHVLCK